MYAFMWPAHFLLLFLCNGLHSSKKRRKFRMFWRRECELRYTRHYELLYKRYYHYELPACQSCLHSHANYVLIIII